jgi:hypothetical protein
VRRRHRASAASAQVDPSSVVLTLPSRASFGHTCGSCGRRLPRATSCKRCWLRKGRTRQVQAVNADTASAEDLAGLLGMLRQVWTTGGDTNSVFGNPSVGAPRDPTFDGGEYDDHRAFGWERASLADPAPLLRTVADDLLTGQQAKLIPDLELIGQADLNANGKLDAAATPGGGTSA